MKKTSNMAHVSECITCVTIKITWNFRVYVCTLKVNNTVVSHNLSTTHIHWCPLDVRYKESYFPQPGFWDLHFHSDVIDSPLNLSASRQSLLAEFGTLVWRSRKLTTMQMKIQNFAIVYRLVVSFHAFSSSFLRLC